jgi:hypothetical protein
VLIGRILKFPGVIIGRLAWRLGLGRCEIIGEKIVLRKSLFTCDAIQSSHIKSWSIHPEMGFDVVVIELENGESFTWFDEYNDIITNLRKLASSKER